MESYINSFYNANLIGSKQVITCVNKPVEYKNYLIYERVKTEVFDIVKDGVCIGMCAGINGAKKIIDSWIDEK